MDVSLLLQHSQYGIPVVCVLVCAILVFVFGFKKAEQPPFAHLSVSSDVDRKLANKKRSKTKEKKAANGQLVTEKASPAKKTVIAKSETTKKSSSKNDEVDGKLKEKKQEDDKPVVVKKEKNHEAKSGKENKVEQVKNKKNLKNLLQEKPVDFDEGDWEQAYSRKDKKNKKKEEDTPSKKSKKNAKKAELINEVAVKEKDQEKPEIKDKVAKETENKELKEKDNKDVVLTPIISDNLETEKKVEKKAEISNKVEKPEKEEKKTKSKKSKKNSESEKVAAAVKSEPKIIEKKVEEVIVKDVPEPIKSEQVVEKPVAAFDELGDVWTEAKPQKKSKKKARRDN